MWLSLLGLLLFVAISIEMIGAMMATQEQENHNSNYELSEIIVTVYQPMLASYAEQYGIIEYSRLLMAIMMQETQGKTTDPMGMSENPLNTIYLQEPNGILSTDYSIQIGVKYFAECIRLSGCSGLDDTQNLSLAIQGYDFGTDFIIWAEQNGGYSTANVQTYSQLKCEQLGCESYGDPFYVSKVLRYFHISTAASHEKNPNGFINPLAVMNYGSPFGMRNGRLHGGQDFPAATGTEIYSVMDGEVVTAHRWKGGRTGNDSWGNYLVIKHANNIYTLYAHNSALLVREGDIVAQGQTISKAGNTGNSFGSHLHFEVWDGGYGTVYRKNPALYLPPK